MNGTALSQPALLTSTSTRPCWSWTARTMAATPGRSVTSVCSPTAVPPIAAAVAAAVEPSRSVTATIAPSAASFSAIARPMPCPAPVTIAIFPSSVPMGAFLRSVTRTYMRRTADDDVVAAVGEDAAVGGERRAA